jgi:GDP-4-dehydro-6-deoxy-D-mannose reductase
MKALITGANGFAGTHLVRLLLSQNWRLLGITNDLSLNPELKPDGTALRLEEIDICDAETLLPLLREFRPEVVFHLAAITGGPFTRAAVDELYRVNVRGTQNLLFSLIEAGLHVTTLVTGSGAVYGSSALSEAASISEDALPAPETVYGASKLAQESLASSFGRSGRMNVLVTRAFNYTGPGEGPAMACSAFAKQIVECEMKNGGIVRVGNLDSHRDYCDVRDVVRAYYMVATKPGASGVFNVCSGRAVRMRDVLDVLVSLSRVEMSVETDPARVRAVDTSYQRGDRSRITQLVGWEPLIPLERTLSDLLDFWRVKLIGAGLDQGGSPERRIRG